MLLQLHKICCEREKIVPPGTKMFLEDLPAAQNGPIKTRTYSSGPCHQPSDVSDCNVDFGMPSAAARVLMVPL
jgi:hypothetical protein